MKQIIYVLMAIIMVASVSAINVDCDGPGWNSPMCMDYELQGEFNQVVDMIEDNSDDIEDVEELAKKNKKVNKKQSKQISELDDYVFANEEDWMQDSSGTSFFRVEKFLKGDFIGFLKDIFVQKNDYALLEDKVFELESKVYFMERNMSYTNQMVVEQAILFEMEQKQVSQVEHGKYSCSLNTNTGLKLVCLS